MLPPETLLETFDYLSLADLLIASHVCARWRTVAHRHPTFWRTIQLSALSTSALDFFHARLDASQGAVNLTLLLETPDSPARVQSVVLPALAHNLYRIRELVINFPMDLAATVFHTLQKPAPILAELNLFCGPKTAVSQSTDALSSSLFDDHAPQLREVGLINVRLPSLPPAAFRLVQKMWYNFCLIERFPIEVFAFCPHLTDLGIYGGDVELPSTSYDIAVFAIPPQLKSLEVVTRAGCAELLRVLPSRSIPSLTVDMNAIYLRRALIDELSGPLELQLWVEGIHVSIAYVAGHMTRAFRGRAGKVELDGALLAEYLEEELLARVHSVTISVSALGCIPLLRRLPACTHIDLWVQDDYELEAPTVPLELPVLSSLAVLPSRGAAQLHARDLTTFFERGITGWPGRLKVELENIAMIGTLPERLRAVIEVTAARRSLLIGAINRLATARN